MPRIHTGSFEKTEIDQIGRLINSLDFDDYKYYRVFDQDTLRKYVVGQISDLLTTGGGHQVIVAREKDKIVGLVSLAGLSWAEEVFGFKMAEIRHILALDADGNKGGIIQALLSAVFKICKEEKICHLSCRVSTDDYPVVHVLEEEFRLVETLVTYLFSKSQYRHLPEIKSLCAIRYYRESDLTSLIEMVKGSFLLSRFYQDPHIPDVSADKFYAEWIRQSCQSSAPYTVLVAERKDKIVGFLSYKINEELQKFTGYKIAGQGLSSVLKGEKGVYPALLWRGLQDRCYDFCEYDSQLNNYEAIRVWQKLGFKYVRSKYTFHKWLGQEMTVSPSESAA